MRGATAVLSAVPIIVVLVATLAHAGDPKAEAKERFDKGVALFKDGDFDAALVEFRAAYNAQPHYAVRYNIGICLHKLHRYKEAFEELEAYLLEGGDEVPEAKQAEVQGILDELRALVGMVKIKCAVEGAALLVDGEPAAKWTVVVDVGEHEIEVRAPGYKPFMKAIEVPGGKALSIEAAWGVDFLDGTVGAGDKGVAAYARAVRGGL